MRNTIQNWLVIGIPQNWETALSQPVPIWGLKPRFQAEFQNLKVGDILWFYATSPISGVIGIGVVKDKYDDRVNLVWKEEFEKKEVIWPLRFRIHVLKVLPRRDWGKKRIKINDFNLFWQLGFQPLKPEYIIELSNRASKVFGIINKESVFFGPTITQPLLVKEKQAVYTPEEKQVIISHRELQEQIAEIGKLQFYYTELEYPIELPNEKKNLDVVWKREISGVPTFVFEVELSGMIERAIERLKFAYLKFNSRPRIIVPEDIMPKVHNILSAGEKKFREDIRIYEPLQIEQLFEQKRQLKTLEQNLALY